MPTRQEADDPRGRGESAAGQVVAVVGADGLLESLSLNPRSLRMGSDELAEHVVSAVRAAQQDLVARTDEPPPDAEEAEGDAIDPAELMHRLDELEVQSLRDFASLNATLDELLRRMEGHS
ncbi:hypothetical protein HTZ77_08510 [Nonomuraea sp. SMC257]|uniref:YbaB/EbfC family nucleoid-associated protein n=1 Tax=Nonomuraea montanisoli TaxID=2741721 RepID=A0A7Y6I668_9ACTN|nr:YbaB/EbfC family nucleoid-associated protein [Nonomuraea montanisoli]NUW31465.1 hypothetical protein [Nonomuraea montanisoli]